MGGDGGITKATLRKVRFYVSFMLVVVLAVFAVRALVRPAQAGENSAVPLCAFSGKQKVCNVLTPGQMNPAEYDVVRYIGRFAAVCEGKGVQSTAPLTDTDGKTEQVIVWCNP